MERLLPGWELRTDEKWDPKVGPTKRGYSTGRIPVVGSQAEVRILDATLGAVAVGRPGRPLNYSLRAAAVDL